MEGQESLTRVISSIAEEEEASRSSSVSLPLLSLNHVSFLCKSVSNSVQFYEQVLGFVLVQRPSSFDFQGAWLFNYGIGIHLLERSSKDDFPEKEVGVINPKDNHISFQCADMRVVMSKLEELGVKYVKAVVEEGGVQVDQLFFHDPDGYMVEICNCENLPLLPLSTCPIKNTPPNSHSHDYQQQASSQLSGKQRHLRCAGAVDEVLMDKLVAGMMDISF